MSIVPGDVVAFPAVVVPYLLERPGSAIGSNAVVKWLTHGSVGIALCVVDSDVFTLFADESGASLGWRDQSCFTRVLSWI